MYTNNRFSSMNLMNDNKHNKNVHKKHDKQNINTPTTNTPTTNTPTTDTPTSNTPTSTSWNQQHIISKIKMNSKINPNQGTYTDPLLFRFMKYKNSHLKDSSKAQNAESDASDTEVLSVRSDITTESEIQRKEDESFEDFIYVRYYKYFNEYCHYKNNYLYDNFQSDVVDYLEDLEKLNGNSDEYLESFEYPNDY